MSDVWATYIDVPESTCDAEVVFLDIEKYSRRTSRWQHQLIRTFSALVAESLWSVLEPAPRSVSLKQQFDQIMKIPTGDGMAIVFPPQSRAGISLHFSEVLQNRISDHNLLSSCPAYNRQHYCDCHDNLRVRAGIARGQVVVYRDINGSPNVAGQVINAAARIMDLADPGQVLLTREAFTSVTDIPVQPRQSDAFLHHPNVRIKHGLLVDIYQYAPADNPTIDRHIPLEVIRSSPSRRPKGVVPSRMARDGVPRPRTELNEVKESDLQLVAELYEVALLKHGIKPNRAFGERLNSVGEFYRAHSGCFEFVVLDVDGVPTRIGFTCVLPLTPTAFLEYRAGKVSEWQLCRTDPVTRAPLCLYPPNYREPVRHLLIQSINLVP